MSWLSRLFGKDQGPPVLPLALVHMAGNEEIDRLRQQSEDRKVEQDARRTAEDMFNQWMEQERTGRPAMVIPKPYRWILTVYAGQKPKYDSAGYQSLIKKLFKEMTDDYLSAKKSRF